MNYFGIVLFSVLSVLSSTAYSADTLQISDTPSFSTNGQNIWGTGEGVNTKTFDTKVTNIHDAGITGETWGLEFDNTVANYAGPTQFLCPAGSFVDPFTDNCYTCPTGFSHNPLKNVNDAGVCFNRYNETTADKGGDVQFICPADSFLDIASGSCYSCPSGYSHNPLLPANVSGVCSITNTQFEEVKSRWRCGSGEFGNLAQTSCYSCRSGYSHNSALGVNTNGVCYKVGLRYARADSCGTGHKCSITGGIHHFPYVASSCPPHSCKSPIRDGSSFRWYSCNSWSRNPLVGPTNGRACFITDNSYIKADYKGSQSCSSGTVKNLIDGNCYGCPTGYTNVLGVCTKIDNTTAVLDEPSGFLCGEGEFLSGTTCFTCPVGLEHDFLLTAEQQGVCFKQENITADGAGNQGFLCPAGSFFNAVDGDCYSCADDYTWNPLVPINENGSCFKLILSDDPTNSPFEIGYSFDSAFNYEQGWTGGVIVDPGSVDVDYSPNINIEITEAAQTPEGWQTFVIDISQGSGTSIDMSTRWPGINLYLDQWTDTSFRTDVSFLYPEQDPDTLQYVQSGTNFTLWNADTNGRATLADDPLFGFEFSTDFIGLTLLGLPIGFTGFDPPLEIAYPLVKIPGGLEIGVVVVEGGFQGPLLGTPSVSTTDILGNTRPFDGDYTETKGTGASNTFIKQSVTAGERNGFRLFAVNQGLKDTDVARIDLDIDGLISLGTKIPLGLKLSQKFGPANLATLWTISADVADLDYGGVFSFEAFYEFKPNLDVTLSFSAAVRLIDSAGVIGSPITTLTQKMGDNMHFVHPGGELTITTQYSVGNNTFSNDTDLNVTSLISGEVLTIDAGIFGVPKALLPKLSLVTYEADPHPEPLKVMDLNYLDNGSVAEFTLGGFEPVTGSPLVVTADFVVDAVCKNYTANLDATGNVQISPANVDGGSVDFIGALTLSVNPSQFSCAQVGDNTVSLLATSSNGASASCDAVVNVADVSMPIILVNTPGVTEAVDANGALVSLVVSANDNCDVVFTRNPSSNQFALGTTTVAIVAEDSSGNQSLQSVAISVVDTTPPIVTPPIDIALEASDVLTPVILGVATAVDLVDGSLIPTANMVGPLSLGVHTVIWSVTDNAGNTGTASQTVTIVDTTPPVLSVPVDSLSEANAVLSNVVIGQATATDIFNVTINNNAPATYPLGTTIVTWTATDDSGNSSSANQQVVVVDTTPPLLVIPSAVTAEANAVLSTVNIGQAVATDIFSVTVSNNAPATYPLGNTSVIWTAMDVNGNYSSAIQQVVVVDTTAPVLTIPTDVTSEASALLSTLVLGQATAVDIFNVTIVNNAPLVYPLGVTNVTWTATDENGNSSNVIQYVTFVDTTPPSIALSCLADTIWPPNHKLVLGSELNEVSDTVDDSPIVLIDVSLSEVPHIHKKRGSVKNKGSKNKKESKKNKARKGSNKHNKPLWVTEVEHDSWETYVLADRNKNGDGRIYTTLVTVTDFTGNTTQQRCESLVPKKKIKKGSLKSKKHKKSKHKGS